MNKNKKNKSNMNSELQLFSNFVIFQTKNGKVNIDVFFLMMKRFG
jgi:hypothetical protein